MGEYDPNYNYEITVAHLKRSLRFYTLEVQLVWLVEVLLLCAYMCNRGNSKLRQRNGKDLFYLRNIQTSPLYAGKCDLDVLSKLISFRNEFVHKGSTSAYNLYQELISTPEDLKVIAKLADVELNLNFCIYDILGDVVKPEKES